MLQRGRGLFCVLAMGLVALVLVTFRRLPPVVASHFDAAGMSNGWSSRPAYALLLLVIGILLPLGITVLITSLTRSGPARLNIPHRDYWTRPEHRQEAVRRVRAYVWWLGCIMAGTAVLIHSLVVAAHAHQPPRLGTGAFVLVLATVLLGIGAWTVGWYRLLQRPQIRHARGADQGGTA
jgi:uncharacterized membrane protein